MTDDTTMQPHHVVMVELACDALMAAVRGDEEAANTAFQSLVAIDPRNSMVLAIITWVDGTCQLLKWEPERVARTPPTMVIIPGRNPPEHLDIPLAADWIAQVFRARTAMDAEEFFRLLREVNAPGRLAWIDLLLNTCAATVRAHRQRAVAMN